MSIIRIKTMERMAGYERQRDYTQCGMHKVISINKYGLRMSALQPGIQVCRREDSA